MSDTRHTQQEQSTESMELFERGSVNTEDEVRENLRPLASNKVDIAIKIMSVCLLFLFLAGVWMAYYMYSFQGQLNSIRNVIVDVSRTKILLTKCHP